MTARLSVWFGANTPWYRCRCFRGGRQGQTRSRGWPCAANSGSLQGGQFLDGGLGAVGMQMHDVTIDCPVAIANNVLSIVVSGVASQGVTVRDVTFA